MTTGCTMERDSTRVVISLLCFHLSWLGCFSVLEAVCFICVFLLFSRRDHPLLSRISQSGEHMAYGQQPGPHFSRSLPVPSLHRLVVSLHTCVCVFALTQRCLQQIKMNLDEWPKWTVPQLVQQLWKSAGKVSYVAVISCQSDLLLTRRKQGLKSAIRPDKLPGIHQKVTFFCLYSQFSDQFRGSSL